MFSVSGEMHAIEDAGVSRPQDARISSTTASQHWLQQIKVRCSSLTCKGPSKKLQLAQALGQGFRGFGAQATVNICGYPRARRKKIGLAPFLSRLHLRGSHRLDILTECHWRLSSLLLPNQVSLFPCRKSEALLAAGGFERFQAEGAETERTR